MIVFVRRFRRLSFADVATPRTMSDEIRDENELVSNVMDVL